jgi:hypothetical protein
VDAGGVRGFGARAADGLIYGVSVEDEPIPLLLSVGGLSRRELLAALRKLGVRLNASAEVLLNSDAFDGQRLESFYVVQHTVAQLGFTDGANLSSIIDTGRETGLSLCPATTGPYLRLVMIDQPTAPDSVMSNGSAPSGSITVAAAPLRNEDDYPKGFYLRSVDGVLWLRGYRASDRHVWSPHDRLAFRDNSSSAESFS